jgi:hypothetical protein
LKQHKKAKKMPNMNYNNYEGQIVEHYGVELINFPGGEVSQPGTLTRAQLQALIAALEDTNEDK